MKSIWQEETRRELHDRMARLAWDRRAEWGRFTAPKMVCHLADSLRMAVGDLKVAPKKSPIRYPPLKQLIVYLAPFPKGVPTAPELLAREPREWTDDVADVQSLLGRAAASRTTDAWPDHPVFGTLSKRAWGVLIYRHMDHHLRQFGA
jgi:Protein of unknown function (DUF1569)